jgi:putative transcriptional regulator
MNIKHHLDEATLVSYAAGSISQAMALVAACHISFCPSCQKRASESEAIGGLLLDGLDEVDISEDALDRVMACLDNEPDIEPSIITSKKLQNFDDDLPKPLRECLDGSLDEVPWKRIVTGVYYHDLPFKAEKGGVSKLLKIAPGKSMLPHTHDGNELTLILRGSFSDEVGRFTVGDIADLDDEIEHQPLVDSDEDCICLIATDAPLKFSTLFGRLVQPMTGF